MYQPPQKNHKSNLCIIKAKVGGTLLNPNEKYAYWEDIAEYDLKTAEAMYQSGRYLYVIFNAILHTKINSLNQLINLKPNPF
jgi:hypothetical protein